jgi:hypothetical protein
MIDGDSMERLGMAFVAGDGKLHARDGNGGGRVTETKMATVGEEKSSTAGNVAVSASGFTGRLGSGTHSIDEKSFRRNDSGRTTI